MKEVLLSRACVAVVVAVLLSANYSLAHGGEPLRISADSGFADELRKLPLDGATLDACEASIALLPEIDKQVQLGKGDIWVLNAGGSYITLSSTLIRVSEDPAQLTYADLDERTRVSLGRRESSNLEQSYDAARREYEARDAVSGDHSFAHESCLLIVGVVGDARYVHAYLASTIEAKYPKAAEAIRATDRLIRAGD